MRRTNFILVGHVDHGKSTLGGHFLRISGAVSEHELSEAARLAEQNKRESWKYAYLLDTLDSERERGKTWCYNIVDFDYGENSFRFYDTPGHKSFIREMIAAVRPGLVAVLVVSVVPREFVAGFGNGQIKEQLVILRSLGVTNLVLALNKLDLCPDPQQADEVEGKLRKYAHSLRFESVDSARVSAYVGTGLPALLERIAASAPPETKTDPGGAVELRRTSNLRDETRTSQGKQSLLLTARFYQCPKILSMGSRLNLHFGADTETGASIEQMCPAFIRGKDDLRQLKCRMQVFLDDEVLGIADGCRVLLRQEDTTLGYGIVAAQDIPTVVNPIREKQS
ncbi:MAG: GTP-binding protein [Sulfobacillus sp.]